MKLQFDANQQFQLDAVAAIVDLFDGQPQGAPEYSIIRTEGAGVGALIAGQEQTELGVGNRLLIDTERLSHNLRAVQARNEIGNATVRLKPDTTGTRQPDTTGTRQPDTTDTRRPDTTRQSDTAGTREPDTTGEPFPLERWD